MKELKIRWIGQGGYLLDDGQVKLCIDPYLSDVVNRVAGRPRMVAPPFAPADLKCDAVICTHNHLDHVDIDAIPHFCHNGILFHEDYEKICAPYNVEVAYDGMEIEF